MRPDTAVLLLLALACVSLRAPAQSCFHLPSDTPNSGASSFRPFGNTNPIDPSNSDLRYQVQVPASVLGNQPLDICEIYAAPAGDRRREFLEFQVRLGHNPSTFGVPMTFNMVGFTSVVVGTNQIERSTTADQWWPLGMVVPFRYVPANGELVVEFRVRGGGAPTGTGDAGFRTDPSVPYAVAAGGGFGGTLFPSGGIKLRFCTDGHHLIEYGGGACPGSNGLEPRLEFTGSAQLGGPGFQVRLTDAVVRPNTACALFWGFRVRSGPFDLTAIGMTDCAMYTFADVVTTAFTSTGTASIPISLPIGTTPCQRVWAQWFLLDPGANPLGVVSSNFGAVLVGN